MWSVSSSLSCTSHRKGETQRLDHGEQGFSANVLVFGRSKALLRMSAILARTSLTLACAGSNQRLDASYHIQSFSTASVAAAALRGKGFVGHDGGLETRRECLTHKLAEPIAVSPWL